MKKIRKLLAIILSLVIFASVSMGCGGNSTEEEKEIVITEDEEKLEETNIKIEEQVLVNENNIVITAKEYIRDSVWGDGIRLLIENNSDKDVTIGCNALIVNNFMIDDLFSANVAAGKKENEILYLSTTELEAAGIDIVGQIEIYFHVYDDATYDTIFDTDCITIKTSEFDSMDVTIDDDGYELYNSGGIRIVGKAVDENSFWGTAVLLFCENTSGKNVGISVEDMSVNGYMIDPAFSMEVYNGKMALGDITILSSELEEDNIESVEKVELKFHIYDVNTYDTIIDTEPITFSVQ